MESKEKALLCAKIASDNKASDIAILLMTNLIVITDYFVICSALNHRHAISVAEEIEIELKKQGTRCFGKEGMQDGKWALLDYGDVVVHVYLKEAREYYELEELWSDAPRIPFEE